MKKAILCGVAALALCALPVRASDFAVTGSYWDTKDADQALGVGGRLRFGIVDLRATYFSDVTADTDPESRDFEISAIPLEAGLAFKFAQTDTFQPYVGGGVGYYLLDTSRGDIDDELGYYAVLGADFARSGSGLGFTVEAIYRNMEATVRNLGDPTDPNDNTDVSNKADIELAGLGVNAGLVWHF
jgi:hypothetical protein